MTVLLDAFAVLALLKDEPAAAMVEHVLAHEVALLTAVGVAEVMDHLVRLQGATADEAALDVAQLGLAEAVPLEADLALRSGVLRASHYHRRDRAVSMADCVLAETARTNRWVVASADPRLLDLCRAEGIDVIRLPDSDGRTWSPPGD